MQRYMPHQLVVRHAAMVIGGEGRQPISHPQWKRFIVTT